MTLDPGAPKPDRLSGEHPDLPAIAVNAAASQTLGFKFQVQRLGCVSNVVEILWRRSPSGLVCT